jgi:hypothetical protein
MGGGDLSQHIPKIGGFGDIRMCAITCFHRIVMRNSLFRDVKQHKVAVSYESFGETNLSHLH